jgi:hypothetical protein
MTTDPYEVRDQIRKNRSEQDVLADERQKFRQRLYAQLLQSIHNIYQGGPFLTAARGNDVQVEADGELLFSARVEPGASEVQATPRLFQFMQNGPGHTWGSVCSGLFTLDYILEKAAVVAGNWLFKQERVNASNDS